MEFYGHCPKCGQPPTTAGFTCGCFAQPRCNECTCLKQQLAAKDAEIEALKAENTTLREQVSRLSAPVSGYEKCGARAKSFISREGSFFPCVLEKGHDGPHIMGGNCFRHGLYAGDNCPHWPTCARSAARLEGK